MSNHNTRQTGAAVTYALIALTAIFVIGGLIYLGSANNQIAEDPGLEELANVDLGDVSNNRLESIENNPEAWMGQTVTIQGEVATIYTDRSFQLASTDWIEDEVAVITREPLPAQLLEDRNDTVDEEEIVTVTGTVRRMTPAEIEKELGPGVTFTPSTVIMAEQISVLDQNTFPGGQS